MLNELLDVKKLSDGFYFFKDPRQQDCYGIMHRLNGETWRIGESESFPDSEWVDGISFYAIPTPNS